MTRTLRVHGGQGRIGVKYFFGTGTRASPAIVMMYVLPPGTSEGLHAHRKGDARRGSYDEYYHVIAGRGRMTIDGETITIKAGDHILTPNGVPHDLVNASARTDLKVYLVALRR